MKIEANEESPLINPAFVIEGRGDRDVKLALDGKSIGRGDDFRFGHYRGLEGSDLVAWIQGTWASPFELKMSPAAR